MKPVLQGLLIAGEQQKQDILNGTKRATIREGWRDYRIDENILIGCHILNWCILSKVTYCHRLTLKDLTIDMLESDGYSSLQQAIEDLSKYYPNINENSLITYIEWEFK